MKWLVSPVILNGSIWRSSWHTWAYGRALLCRDSGPKPSYYPYHCHLEDWDPIFIAELNRTEVHSQTKLLSGFRKTRSPVLTDWLYAFWKPFSAMIPRVSRLWVQCWMTDCADSIWCRSRAPLLLPHGSSGPQ